MMDTENELLAKLPWQLVTQLYRRTVHDPMLEIVVRMSVNPELVRRALSEADSTNEANRRDILNDFLDECTDCDISDVILQALN